jgi:acid-sensing ion channel, other
VIWRRIKEVKDSLSLNKGFKLVLHLPCEIPRFDKQYYRFPLEKSATLIVHPSYIETDKQLENYNVNLRRCYFENERKLKYFKRYTRTNCQIECASNQTLKVCKCIHHSMPRMKSDKVCDYEKLDCYEKVRRDTMFDTMKKSLESSSHYEERSKSACDCLPSCTSLRYEGEISHDELRYFGRYKNNM